MKNKLFLILIYMLFNMTSFCQTSEQVQSRGERDSRTIEQKMSGTYEVFNSNQKTTYLLSNQNLLDIESKREDDEEVIFQLNSYVRIRILPRSVINTPGFIPLKN